MSSKVLRGEPDSVEPMKWASLTGTGAIVAGHQAAPRSSGGLHDATAGPDPANAENRIRELEAEVERRSREAFQKGQQQGQAEGRKSAQAELSAELQKLGRTVAEIAGLRHAVRRETEEELVRLSLAIARRIIHRELTVDPEALRGLVRSAIEKIELRELHRVRTHPAHAAALTGFMQQIGAPQKVDVTGDPSLERGAAILETARGHLDASVDTQLAEIERGFTDVMGKSS